MVSSEELKAGGLIPQRQKKMVTVRCMASGGRLTSQRLRAIADVADKCGIMPSVSVYIPTFSSGAAAYAAIKVARS